MASAVKGHVYKVVKKFVKISWIIHDLEASKVMISYWMNSWIKISIKVIHSTIFFGHSMTSEVKGHFYKVVDNYVKCMCKKFRKNIMNYSWYRSFESYDFILNDFIDKYFRKGHTLNNF